MKNSFIIEKEEALIGNTNVAFLNRSLNSFILTPKPSAGLVQACDWIKQYICKIELGPAFKEEEFVAALDNKIVLFDSSMQPDGAFISFCKEYKFEITNLFTEAISVLSYADKNFDPFIIHGILSIKISNDFTFIKSSILYNQSNGTDNSSFCTLINKNDYDKYIEIKSLFIKWLRKREGTVVKIVGGEDYLQDVSYTWDNLFFGEKAELKKDLKKTIDSFLDSKQYYNDNNIPWNLSILIEGIGRCCKTSLINTIISEYDILEPITINYFNTDDSILNVLFKSAEEKHYSLLFIDNVDDYIDQQFITSEHLYDLIDSFNGNSGNILLFTCQKIPDIFKDSTFGFDKIINVEAPDYDAGICTLFKNYVSQQNIKDLQKVCKANALSYGHIYKLYKLFVKSLQIKKASKKKEVFTDLIQILTSIIKEDEKLNRARTKKIGLLNKK